MKKKIAFIHKEFPFGGGERVTIDIANYLLPKDFEIVIFTTCFDKDKICDLKISPNLEILTMPSSKVEKSLQNQDFIYTSIKDKKIDVVVSVGFWLPDLIERIKKNTDCKTVFALHNVPFWENCNKLSKACFRAKENVLKRLEYIFLSYPKYKLFRTVYKKKLERKYQKGLTQYDALMVLCDTYKSLLINKFGVEFADKICVINNSEKIVVDVNLDKKKQFIYVGRLDYAHKRVDRLIKAWSKISEQLTDWQLKIIGRGPDSESLKKYANKLGCKRVYFTGYYPDLTPFYSDAAVICLVSNFEGWPLCLTEAQASGVIPIAFNCTAGVEDIISPTGVNGFLVDPFDVDKFAENMLYVAHLSDAERKTIQNNVLQKAKDYSIEIIGEKWRKLFMDL